MKMFEYMAAGKPIVASNLPSIGEVLNEENALLVESDNPKMLAEGINKVLQNRDFSAKISHKAFNDVQSYSWHRRSGKVLSFIGDS